jgi:hypothetical protein
VAAPRRYEYDHDRLLEDAPKHPSLRALSTAHRIEPTSFVHYLRRNPDFDEKLRGVLAHPAASAEASKAAIRIVGDDAFFEVDPVELGDADKMLRTRGFDPADWHLRDISLTEWGHNPETGGPYQRLKISLRCKLTMGVVAYPVPYKPVMPPKIKRTKGSRTGFLASDFHAPFHHKRGTAAFLNLLRDVQPDFGIFPGDIADVPRPSRHRRNPGWDTTPKESFGSAYREILYPTREILPDIPIDVVTGNHDTTRVKNWILESQPDLLDLCDPSDPEEVSIFSPRKLMGLDSLHMRAVDPVGEYADGRVVVTRDLSVIHGESTGRNAAGTTLDSFGHSLAFGHTHHKSTTYSTANGFDGFRVHRALELGCMCVIEGGLGYVRNPKWQQGFGMVTIHEDGVFHFEHVDFIDGDLLWRGERWKA